MCVIAVKLSNVRPIPKEVISQCWDSNPHGAGVAIIKKDTITVKFQKGFLNVSDLIDYCENNIGDKDIAVYHFRLATSGKINPEMCHPFPITEELELTALSGESNTLELLFHNGVLGEGSKNLSDTAMFAGYLRKKLDWRDKNLPIKIYSASNKFVVVNSKSIRLYGQWIEDPALDGALFSNMSYQHKIWILNKYGKIVQPTCPLCKSEKITTVQMAKDDEIFECNSCGAVFDGYRKIISEPEQIFKI